MVIAGVSLYNACETSIHGPAACDGLPSILYVQENGILRQIGMGLIASTGGDAGKGGPAFVPSPAFAVFIDRASWFAAIAVAIPLAQSLAHLSK
jgi:hypothetical protein